MRGSHSSAECLPSRSQSISGTCHDAGRKGGEIISQLRAEVQRPREASGRSPSWTWNVSNSHLAPDGQWGKSQWCCVDPRFTDGNGTNPDDTLTMRRSRYPRFPFLGTLLGGRGGGSSAVGCLLPARSGRSTLSEEKVHQNALRGRSCQGGSRSPSSPPAHEKRTILRDWRRYWTNEGHPARRIPKTA